MDVGISYTDSIDTAREVLLQIAKNDPEVLQDEDVLVGVKSLGDNAVILTYRVFVKGDDYWTTLFRLNETIKNEFDKAGLNFPFPQRDVHIYNEK